MFVWDGLIDYTKSVTRLRRYEKLSKKEKNASFKAIHFFQIDCNKTREVDQLYLYPEFERKK